MAEQHAAPEQANVLSVLDRRLLDACLRYARRHRGLTASNPSVGTLLVQFDGDTFVIVGRGVTALGGRPHAEPIAIDMAAERAKGATAYVSLEPCAHHGATPPCAQALIDAGVKRVVTAWIDPDSRVDGKGHDMLRDAGIEVTVSCSGTSAPRDLSGYLTRKNRARPHVLLKLAVSADGKLGRRGEEVPITGAVARAYTHALRARSDAILVGRGTVEADDPDLTCRLPGLETRSPHRFVLDTKARISPKSRLVQSARSVPVSLISAEPALPAELAEAGVAIFAAESHEGAIALPEVLEDMAARGFSALMVEGGAEVAAGFLNAGLVDEIALFTGKTRIGPDGIGSPVTPETVPEGFTLDRSLDLGDDRLDILFRS